MRTGLYPYILLLSMLVVITACNETAHKYTNALVDETSPYLLQHAHNPVNWQPWGEDIWQEAEEENKLVIISIGYSSCHWCHVMEEETFEDEIVAGLMNEKYISVKVDREERPDVDQVYMTALQLLTGSGGWPLNIIATPEGKPLYGGTYHTKNEWMKVLKELDSLYHADPQRAADYANRVAQGVQAVNRLEGNPDALYLDRDAIDFSVLSWKTLWDTENGGMAGQEKFMLAENLRFLMQYGILSGDKESLDFAKGTLDKMAMGGIYDHVGGGFFRYSTDPAWNIPHFEKMLYDNAQALSLYSQGYAQFGEPLYLVILDQVSSFLDREMSNGKGAYYAALDADSQGREGAYYLWQQNELQEVLGEDFQDFSRYFPLTNDNLVEENAFVLNPFNLPVNDGENEDVVAKWLNTMPKFRKSLLEARQQREKPGIDDKIITSWNALLIKGFVDAYKATGKQDFLTKAEGILDFLKNNAMEGEDLRHTYKPNARFVPGFLEDYAFLADAAIHLYTVSGNEDHLDFAGELHQIAKEKFTMEDSELFKYKEEDNLIATIVKTDDAVLPSPNAVMAHNYFRLGHINYSREYMDKTKSMLQLINPRFQKDPHTYARWGQLMLQHAYPYFEIAVAGSEAKDLALDLHKRFLPDALVVYSESESDISLFQNRFNKDDTYIYVCRDNTCKLPVQSTAQALEQMDSW